MANIISASAALVVPLCCYGNVITSFSVEAKPLVLSGDYSGSRYKDRQYYEFPAETWSNNVIAAGGLRCLFRPKLTQQEKAEILAAIEKLPDSPSSDDREKVAELLYKTCLSGHESYYAVACVKIERPIQRCAFYFR